MMAGYSRKDIVAGMQGKSVTLGWGAVSAFSRSRLNHILDLQYHSRLHEWRYLPPFNGEVKAEGELGWTAQLRMIEFGAPRLSFHTASLNDSKAMLTMNIIGGSLGKRNPLSDSFLAQGDLTEAMGYYVELEVDLTLATGTVDRRGRVTLDLAKGAHFNSNLLQGSAAAALSQALRSWFAGLPAHRTVFELGIIDYYGCTALAPKSFILRTQPAPGATVRHADNHGDGAVLAFIRLAGNTSEGQQPDAAFPYLIANDRNGDEELYSATLVVDSNLLEHVTDKRLEVLNSLLFPGQQVFAEVGRDTPHDLAVFGRIEPHSAMLTVSPATVTLRPGGTQQFKLLDAKGNPLAATAWTALSVKSHLAVGDGKITANGLYSAASAQDMGHETLTVVVTAEYKRGDKTVRASARVLVSHEAIELAQRLETLPSTLQSMALAASHASGGSLSWKLLGPELGELQTSGTGAVFTPSNSFRKAPIALQRVQVEQGELGEQVRAGVLLLNAHYAMRLKSAAGQRGLHTAGKAVQRIKPGQGVQFSVDGNDILPGATLVWRALGDGTVNAQGHYTAPANVSSGGDAVVCDLERNGVSYGLAYNTLQISTLDEESEWNSLLRFELSLPAGRGQVYGNRYQQQQIDILVETAPVDQKEYRLTPTERASLVLVELKSNDVVPALPEASQGIEDDAVYATRTGPNAFKQYGLATPMNTSDEQRKQRLKDEQRLQDEPHERRLKSPGTTTYETRYLHVNDPTAVAASFYARFTKDGGGEFTSLELAPSDGTVQVNVAELPTYQLEHYTMARKRVKGLEPGPEGQVGDEYYLEYNSRDYWQFRFANADFVAAEFIDKHADWREKEHVNFSTIRWESESRNEVMASYDGLIFDQRLEKVEAKADPGFQQKLIIEFDEGLEKVSGYTVSDWGNEVESSAFTSGMAVICNDRRDDIAYKPLEEQAYLAQPKVVKFTDENGNGHYVEFSYGAPGLSGNRNVVSWKLVRPKV